jgi:hypothetical protein
MVSDTVRDVNQVSHSLASGSLGGCRGRVRVQRGESSAVEPRLRRRARALSAADAAVDRGDADAAVSARGAGRAVRKGYLWT